MSVKFAREYGIHSVINSTSYRIGHQSHHVMFSFDLRSTSSEIRPDGLIQSNAVSSSHNSMQSLSLQTLIDSSPTYDLLLLWPSASLLRPAVSLVRRSDLRSSRNIVNVGR
eukprot:scaffold14152_cov23-Cyclotella_meneghiniana.AAC.1